MLYVLDTDHLTVLEQSDSRAQQLETRLEGLEQDPTTTIINIQELIRHYFDQLHTHNMESRKQIPYYAFLHNLLNHYSEWDILPFDEAASAKYEELKQQHPTIGGKDLRIAAIVLCHDATLLSGNYKHFRPLLGERVEDWRT